MVILAVNEMRYNGFEYLIMEILATSIFHIVD